MGFLFFWHPDVSGMKLQGNPRTHDPRRIDTPKRVGALDLAFSHVSLVGRSKSQKFHTKLMPASALLGHEHQKGFSSLSDCDHTATHLPSLDLEMQGKHLLGALIGKPKGQNLHCIATLGDVGFRAEMKPTRTKTKVQRPSWWFWVCSLRFEPSRTLLG